MASRLRPNGDYVAALIAGDPRRAATRVGVNRMEAVADGLNFSFFNARSAHGSHHRAHARRLRLLRIARGRTACGDAECDDRQIRRRTRGGRGVHGEQSGVALAGGKRERREQDESAGAQRA
ncbi:MAG: hypothetical protein IPG56_14745 [Caulobacteraceae bacterium]|nr:hypothetical protein [Caulobacteraceae bacterium]